MYGVLCVCMLCIYCLIPYSGLFWREKFFANSCHVRSNGNFGGKIFAVPLAKRSHAYLTRVRVTRVRDREFYEEFFRGQTQSREILENILPRKKNSLYGISALHECFHCVSSGVSILL